ncbi:MAG TPA: hypothetical protein VFX98_10910 [Longimicrobiaceae bacterium]|nr:hypothetical protein [Longimicrobiaceae bacterium]
MDNHHLTGTVQSGGTEGVLPLGGATVTAYGATAGAPREIGTATSDRDGGFSIHPRDRATDSILYATARRDGHVLLATVIGPEIRGAITLNELTTVAAAFAMAQFTERSAIAGNAFGLRIAAGMSENLASAHTGGSSEVLLAPPNADQSNALRSTRALANLLAACVRQHPGAWDTLRRLATPPGGHPPDDTFQALVNIARHPAHNVDDIYRQARELEVYLPSLERRPDAWTLAVKVNDTGDRSPDHKRMFGGPANIAFDRNGNAWIANNVFQGTPNSGDFIVVLQPNGKPADGRKGTPKSPIVGGGLQGPGWGIDIDRKGHVWVGNFGWGPSSEIPAHGSVSEFDAAGRPLSVPTAYLGGTHRVQATEVDRRNNVWLASYGNDSVVVFPGGDPHAAFGYPQHLPGGVHPAPGSDPQPPGTCTFGIAIDPTEEETAWVTYGAGLGWPQANPGSVARFRIENGALKLLLHRQVGKALKSVAADSHGNAWIASSGDDTVYLMTREGHVTGFTGGGIIGPWGVFVDGDDDVWVGNFGTMGVTSDYTDACISKLAGVSSPSGRAVGEPLTPETGYTLHSAGSPVLLHDGRPLYEHGECFSPLMRMTSVTVDQAGNLWAVNNWKPRFGTDFPPKHGNPGGDGIVIFVGLAKPPREHR